MLTEILRREPVRAYVYSVLAVVLTVLMSYGVLDSDEAMLWLAVGSTVLVVPGVEIARSKVTPVSDPRV